MILKGDEGSQNDDCLGGVDKIFHYVTLESSREKNASKEWFMHRTFVDILLIIIIIIIKP